MGLGWSLMVGWGWVIAFVIAFMLLYSMIIIPAEEEFLADKFDAGITPNSKSACHS